MPTGRECLVIRPGAFGDSLMASAVLPGLAAQGYRLSFATNFEGEQTLRHDPYLQGRIRVWPRAKDTAESVKHYAEASAAYDRVVNLVNCIEGEVLKHPGQLAYFWPADQRRRMCAGSYLKQCLMQAGVDGPARIRFTPSHEETEWARDTRATIGPFVMWTLRGSTPHKVYPFSALAISQILARTDRAVVLVGASDSTDLETACYQAARDFLGAAGAGRIYSEVGDRDIRRSLALAQRADVVVGPETVVPMSVAHEPHVRKVVLLSHSAHSNLTADWVATEAIAPNVPCYPCHRLHADFTWCPKDESTGAAACAASIPPSLVADAVVRALEAGR